MDGAGDTVEHDFFSSEDESDKKAMKTPLNVYKSSVKVHIPSADDNEDKKSDLSHKVSSTDSSSVTDVSPLSSPNQTPRVAKKTRPVSSKANRKNHKPKKYYSSSSESENSFDDDVDKVKENYERRKVTKKQQNEMLKQRNDIASYNHRRRLLDVAAQNSMDLSQLLEVILTMNEGKVQNTHDPFGPSIGPPPRRQKNHSFTNEQAYEIDRENQRLLRELARVNKKARPSSAASSRSSLSVSSRSSIRPRSSASGCRPSSSQSRLYHAGRNRILEQQRIERENLALLKRLQSAKSDKNIRRKHLLDQYNKQSNYMSNSISRTTRGTQANKTYQRHLQTHGFSSSKPEWQN